MTGRVRDMILDPAQTGQLDEVIAEGAYYGMQTFDQALYAHVKAGRVTVEDALRRRLEPARLQAAARRRRAPGHDDGRRAPCSPAARAIRRPTPPKARRRPPPAGPRTAEPPASHGRRYPALQLVKCWSMAVDDTCPVCHTTELVGGKWTLLLVRDLADGRSRFCELERSLAGISPRTLSLRLRALEEDGHRRAPHLPRGAAARRVLADPEGARPAADHRQHARVRRRWLCEEISRGPRVAPQPDGGRRARLASPAGAAAASGCAGRSVARGGESRPMQIAPAPRLAARVRRERRGTSRRGRRRRRDRLRGRRSAARALHRRRSTATSR